MQKNITSKLNNVSAEARELYLVATASKQYFSNKTNFNFFVNYCSSIPLLFSVEKVIYDFEHYFIRLLKELIKEKLIKNCHYLIVNELQFVISINI